MTSCRSPSLRDFILTLIGWKICTRNVLAICKTLIRCLVYAELVMHFPLVVANIALRTAVGTPPTALISRLIYSGNAMTLNASDIRLLLAQCMDTPKPCLKIKSIEFFDAGQLAVLELNQLLDEQCVTAIIDLCTEYEVRISSQSQHLVRRISKGKVMKVGYELLCDERSTE